MHISKQNNFFAGKILGKDLIFADGGMGTLLQARGLKPGEVPETWNILHPDVIKSIHRAYFDAGSDYVCTNTFGANREKYHGDIPLRDVIAQAVTIAKEAAAEAGEGKAVALDVGPSGRLMRPSGDFEFDAAYDAFAEEIKIGAAAGADLVAIETMADTYELKAAVLAAKENCDLPVFATVALGDDGKLLTGADVEAVAALLEGLRVDALGLNCGIGPDKALPYVRRLIAATSLPVIVKMNAGIPRVVDGKTTFDIGPEDFAAFEKQLIDEGATIAGGCCGTTPEYIAALRNATRRESSKFKVQSSKSQVQSPKFNEDIELRTPNSLPSTPNPQPRTSNIEHRTPNSAPAARRTIVSSGTHVVEISTTDTIVIGERINPTGKKKLKQALTDRDMAYVLREAVDEAEAGAQILDVNVGVPGLDEPALLEEVVEAVQGVTDLPLQIDTADPVALERAMRHYNGKPLVNSVNGKEESMSTVLPLVAKYGGAVVALTLDESGIPPTAEERVAIAKKIVARGAEYGLKPSDFVIDVLCLSVSAVPGGGREILKALRLVREELSLATILGVSNISFGLPARPLFNSAFYAMALEEGLSAAIINPLSVEMMTVYRAYRAIAGLDDNCTGWIAGAATLPSPQPGNAPLTSPILMLGDPPSNPEHSPTNPLAAAIRRGLKADAELAAKTLLDGGTAPLEVIDTGVIPALEEVGRGFEKGTLFLPQLLMAADAASAAFGEIKKRIPAGTSAKAGPIVLATVHGDIHDIGKNIVKALLENYGFDVIDLGRDVPPEKVVEAVRESKAKLVGLSALMTTTAPAMAKTIAALREAKLDCKVIVGGAVITQDYADQIGADFYSKDAMQTVRIANEVFA